MPRISTLISRGAIGFVAGASLLLAAQGARAQVSASQLEREWATITRLPAARSVTPSGPYLKVKEFGRALNLQWQVAPELTLKSISSYRELSQTQFANSSLNSSAAISCRAPWRARRYSAEMQAIGEVAA